MLLAHDRRSVMAKKATRKKAKKTAKTAKAKKTAQRKSARKTARKTTPKARQTIKYRCSGTGTGGTCSATPKFAHMDQGETVVLDAVNTDVTITFGTNGSPFRSGTNPITITAGSTRNEVVKATAAGHYDYVLSCSECSRQSMAPPE